jgi:4-amino-4-deoxy-L-arabinose transferase-like glycosyltransferase
MKPYRWYLGCVAIACLLTCAALNFLYFPNVTVQPDEQRFLAAATHLAQTGEFSAGSDRAFEMPGTAAFFASIIKVFGSNHALRAIRTAQSLLLVLQAVLIGFTAMHLFKDPLIGAIAATIAAFYPFFLYYQGLLLSEPLFDLLLVAGFASLYYWRGRGSRLNCWWVLTGICFTLATLTKATMTFLCPLLMAAAVFEGPNRFRRAGVVLVTSSLLFAALMSPWWIRNYSVLGRFIPFSTSGWQNAYLGNNPHNPRAGIDWATGVEPDFMQRIRATSDELEREQAYRTATIEHIVSDPYGFLDRMFKKLARFWNIVPNAESFSAPMYRIVSALSFGPILLLALVCAARHWRMPQPFLPIYLLIGYFTALHMVIIASLRYRLPLESFLILLAAEPIGRTFRWLQSYFLKRRAVQLV